MVNGSEERHGTDHRHSRHCRSCCTGLLTTTTRNVVVTQRLWNHGHIAAMPRPGVHGSGADFFFLRIDPS